MITTAALGDRGILHMKKPERGTVDFYSPERKFGFIKPDHRSDTIFVHARSLRLGAIETLKPGDRVEYERVADDRGGQAQQLRRL
jgi:CspA family cold shock protein